MAELNRRDFGCSLATAVAAAGVSSRLNPREAEPGRAGKPNIVFICSDQHSYKYSGFMGHPLLRTPNLDRIAAAGIVFEDAYTGSPVCVPGRSSMMTGMYASDCNSFCNSTVWDGSHPLWGKRLQDVGYTCLATGKLDLNDDFDSGFEEVETAHGHRHNPDITSLFRRPVGYRVGTRPGIDGHSRADRHLDSRRTEIALNFLRESSSRRRPWALYVGLTEPHPDYVALDKYYDMYPSFSIDMPNIPPGHLEDLHLVMQELRHFKRVATPIPEERIRRARAGYYGMISELDEYVGQIWKELKSTRQLEDTLFIYTSDHGESLGEHGLWQKNNLFEVANRVPLVLAGAGLPGNVRVRTPVAHVDVVATILELSGASTANTLRGHSLLPLIHGESGNHPGFAYSECHCEGNCTGSFMIRKGDWKYLHFSWYEGLLFNLADDPGEFNNRIHDPEVRQIKEELEGILRSQLDPEQVTRRAFETQEKMLREMAERMTEDQLFNSFSGRMGPGLAKVLAQAVSERYLPASSRPET